MWLLKEQPSGKRRPSKSEGFLFSNTVIDPATIQAYLETDYRVCGDMPFTLHIGQVNSYLIAAHMHNRVDCSAFLTACNPFSRVVDEDANHQLQQQLTKELTKRGLTFLRGIGQHPSNNWPGEESFLVLGLNLEAAKTLGEHFEQNAIVWNGPDGSPQLVLLR